MFLFSTPLRRQQNDPHRWARPCAVRRRDAKLPNSRRSLSVKSIATAILPIANPPR
jgi:hypothetical protein